MAEFEVQGSEEAAGACLSVGWLTGLPKLLMHLHLVQKTSTIEGVQHKGGGSVLAGRCVQSVVMLTGSHSMLERGCGSTSLDSLGRRSGVGYCVGCCSKHTACNGFKLTTGGVLIG